jgi:hypothetical protein
VRAGVEEYLGDVVGGCMVERREEKNECEELCPG